MNPNRGENIQFEAPNEQAPIPELDGLGNEKAITTQENAPSKQTSAPALTVDPSTLAQSAAQVMPVDDTAATTSAQDDNATTDRIEKVWVDKAKSIVTETKGDPYAQKQQLSIVKAEYIKNRFNKVLKTD